MHWIAHLSLNALSNDVKFYEIQKMFLLHVKLKSIQQPFMKTVFGINVLLN